MKNLYSVFLIVVALAAPKLSHAHCQVPCGIYDDDARVTAMLEDAATVAKACKMIAELEGKTDPQSMQQVVRWVSNKESHAQKIIITMADYYLTQRVKPSQ
ncbi:MAG: superoxide dismutase [Ni], partial [Verrucomicrobiota bacterium]